MKSKRITTGHLCYRKVTFDPIHYGVSPVEGKIKGGNMTKAQEWAKKRNFAKFRLRGVLAALSAVQRSTVTLTTEQSELRRAEIAVGDIVDSWKSRNSLSKKKFMEGGK